MQPIATHIVGSTPNPTEIPVPTEAPAPSPTPDVDGVSLEPTNGIVSCNLVDYVRVLDPFYEKCTTDSGMLVMASGEVQDGALLEANRLLAILTANQPQVLTRLNWHGIPVGVIGDEQVTTDMPEYRDLREDPAFDWDALTRGLGATKERPLVSGAEENLTCSAADPYRGESVFIHELAHTIFEYGLVSNGSASFTAFSGPPDSYWPGGFELMERWFDIAGAAIGSGRWENTYAGVNQAELWAITTQMWFHALGSRSDEYEYGLDRASLAAYEPRVAGILSEVFPSDWFFNCEAGVLGGS